MYQILYIYFNPQVYNKLKMKNKCFPDKGGEKSNSEHWGGLLLVMFRKVWLKTFSCIFAIAYLVSVAFE